MKRPREALGDAESRAVWDDEIDVEEAPSFPSTSPRRPTPEVRIEEFKRNRYMLSLDAPVPGLVYMSETNFPGWSATVNGKPTRILAANYAFRAVEVPAGRNTIFMSYVPPGLPAGTAVSLLACAGVVTLLSLRRFA